MRSEMFDSTPFGKKENHEQRSVFQTIQHNLCMLAVEAQARRAVDGLFSGDVLGALQAAASSLDQPLYPLDLPAHIGFLSEAQVEVFVRGLLLQSSLFTKFVSDVEIEPAEFETSLGGIPGLCLTLNQSLGQFREKYPTLMADTLGVVFQGVPLDLSTNTLVCSIEEGTWTQRKGELSPKLSIAKLGASQLRANTPLDIWKIGVGNTVKIDVDDPNDQRPTHVGLVDGKLTMKNGNLMIHEICDSGTGGVVEVILSDQRDRPYDVHAQIVRGLLQIDGNYTHPIIHLDVVHNGAHLTVNLADVLIGRIGSTIDEKPKSEVTLKVEDGQIWYKQVIGSIGPTHEYDIVVLQGSGEVKPAK